MKISFVATGAMLLASATASPTLGHFDDLKCKFYKCDELCYKYPSVWSWPMDTKCKLYGCEQKCNYPQPPQNPGTCTSVTKYQTVTEYKPGPTKTVTVDKGSQSTKYIQFCPTSTPKPYGN